jgi:gliotoxin/aspirochlorine biosynthesis aminotransferase
MDSVLGGRLQQVNRKLQGLFASRNREVVVGVSMTSNTQVSYLSSIVVRNIFSNETFLNNIININKTRLAESYVTITTLLRRLKIQYFPASAGLYVWAKLCSDVKTWDAEAELAAELWERRVTVSAGRSYAASEPGWYRLTFALRPYDLNKALSIIEEVLVNRKSSSTP